MSTEYHVPTPKTPTHKRSPETDKDLRLQIQTLYYHAGFTMIKPIKWPAKSPDLKPIELIQDEMKNYIEEKYTNYYRSYKRLTEAVQGAWESITKETIQALIRGMKDRCQAVINAQEHSTKGVTR
jgi:hypothetical protein